MSFPRNSNKTSLGADGNFPIHLYVPSLIKLRLFQVYVTYLNTGHWDWSPHKNPLFLVPDLMSHITIACRIQWRRKITKSLFFLRVNSAGSKAFNICSESPEMKKNNFLGLENGKGVGWRDTIWRLSEASWISLYSCLLIFHHQTLFSKPRKLAEM